MSTDALTDPALAAVADARDWQRQAEVATLVAVLDWATAHTVTSADEARPWRPGLRLGGPGCPVVSEYDVWDLACVLGKSPDACTRYLGNALELRHRLPRLWERVLRLQVPVWKAFTIAARTQCLPPAGADQADQALAHAAHTCTRAQVDRTVATALAAHDPDQARDRRDRADRARHVDIGLDQPLGEPHLRDDEAAGGLLSGTVEITGLLDVADALDLDAALTAGAARLAAYGSTETLDVRRSRALGDLARHQPTLELPDDSPLDPPDEAPAPAPAPAGRAVTIYAHHRLGEATATIAGPGPGPGPGPGNGTGTTVLLDQLLGWCRAPGTRVTVKPVIDLAADLHTDAYTPTAALAEQVDLRDRHTCVFPYCTRRRTDRDHTHPWHGTHEQTGGTTSSDNLALLCRAHHRAKTFSAWTYTSPGPGHYTWTSPAGATHHVDRTRDP